MERPWGKPSPESGSLELRRKAVYSTSGVTLTSKRIADAIDRRYGMLDIVINNAGNISPTPLLEITPDQWEKTVRTHLHSTFYCTVEMVRRFLKPKRSGKIVKIHRALRGQRLLWLGRLRVGKGGHHRVYQERGARTASTQHSGQCRAACGTQPNDWRWPNIMAASSAPKRRHA